MTVGTARRASDEEDEEDEEDANLDDFEARANLFVKMSLQRASGSKRDDYKDNMVYQARKDTIAQFQKLMMAKKCANCSAYASCTS